MANKISKLRVNELETLDGSVSHTLAGFLARTNHTGTQTASTISDPENFPVTTSTGEQTLVGALDARVGQSEFDNAIAKRVPYQASDLTVSVGSEGDYETIGGAISYLETLFNTNNAEATINLLSGFIMREQVSVKGQDLSWITIQSEDDEVEIVADDLTQQFPYEVSDTWTSFPAFSAIRGSLPTIGCVFRVSGVGPGENSGKNGVLCYDHSSVSFLPGSGMKDSYCNLYLVNTSSAYAPRCDFTGSYRGGVVLHSASYCCLVETGTIEDGLGYGSDVSNASGDAILVKEASICDARGTVATGVAGVAIHARRGSTVNAAQSIVDGASEAGLRADRASTIYGNVVQGNNCDIGAMCYRGSTIDLEAAVFKDCVQYGISAWQNGTVNALQADVRRAGTAGIYSRSSSVNCQDATCDETPTGILAEDASVINAKNAFCRHCTDTGAYAGDSSIMNFSNGDCQDAGNYGVRAFESSTINCNYAYCPKGDEDSDTDVVVNRGSHINGRDATGGFNISTNTLKSEGIIYA